MTKQPVAWANRDELDNMLSDRTATVAGVKCGWRREPLYATPETPKALDDPRLQELFSSAILGALAFGAQNTNPPPEGHWLTQFWQLAKAEREAGERPTAADALRLFLGSAYPVSTDIDARGYRWSEAYLDQALAVARGMEPGQQGPVQAAGAEKLDDQKPSVNPAA